MALEAAMARVFGTWRDWETAATDMRSLPDLRDMVVDCFASTHGPHFGQTREVLGLEVSAHAIRSSVEEMVRLAFQQVGGSFDRPTPQSLLRVVSFLAERSLEWGVSEDCVFDHPSAMTRAIGLYDLKRSTN